MFDSLFYLISKARKLTRIPAIKATYIHKTSKICSGSLVVGCELGKYTYVGHDSTLINASVGSFCSIADRVTIGGAAHPSTWISTSPVFTEGDNVLCKNFSRHSFEATSKTEVGSDVWIGNNVLIKAGVKIGHGAIIGMGAVVTKSVPDYEIWGGNPARLIRKRFDESTILALLESEWWGLDDSEIKKLSDNFTDVTSFINIIKGSK